MRTFRLFYFALVALLCAGFVSCSDDDEVVKSSQKQILEFAVDDLKAEINEQAKTIALTLPAGTDISKLKPVIKVSDKASISPASEAETDFASPVVYTVTAEDGSTQAYTVTIDVEKLTPFLVKKITVKGCEEFEYIEFTYNADNTLAKYTASGEKTGEFENCVFSYDDKKRVTEAKLSTEGEWYITYSYKYITDKNVELSINYKYSDAEVIPYLYTLNDKGFPVSRIRYEHYEESGNSYEEIRTYTYNADNTFKAIDETYKSLTGEFSSTSAYTFGYDTDSYHPLHNLPAGNLYLYDYILVENIIGITGSGAFAGNCSLYKMSYTTGNKDFDNFENYSSTYEYGEHKFPVKARLATIIEDDEPDVYELTFEYIEK